MNAKTRYLIMKIIIRRIAVHCSAVWLVLLCSYVSQVLMEFCRNEAFWYSAYSVSNIQCFKPEQIHIKAETKVDNSINY